MIPGLQHHLSGRTDKSCLLSFSVCLVTLSLMPCGQVWQSSRLKSWVYSSKGAMQAAGLNLDTSVWVAGHPSSSSTTSFQPLCQGALAFGPVVPRPLPASPWEWLRIGIEIRNKSEQPLIRSANGQAMQNCRGKTKGRHIFSAQCGSTVPTSLADFTSPQWSIVIHTASDYLTYLGVFKKNRKCITI